MTKKALAKLSARENRPWRLHIPVDLTRDQDWPFKEGSQNVWIHINKAQGLIIVEKAETTREVNK